MKTREEVQEEIEQLQEEMYVLGLTRPRELTEAYSIQDSLTEAITRLRTAE